MIFQINQQQRGQLPSFSFQCRGANAAFGNAKTIANRLRIECEAELWGAQYHLIFDPQMCLATHHSLRESMTFSVEQSGEKIGFFTGDIKQTGEKKLFGIFGKGYEFFRASLFHTDYCIYEVGLGNRGHFLCVYEQDIRLVGMIEVALEVKNSLNSYLAYTEDADTAKLLALLALYMDYAQHSSGIQDVGITTQTHEAHYTTNKELLRKYDPNFITHILSLDASNEKRGEEN